MAEKTLNTRIQQKHDIELNWNKAINFIPKIGEIIVYDIDENYTYERFKIGDGTKTIIELPFAGITGLEISDDITDLEGVNIIQNAHTLGGIPAAQYALKSDLGKLPGSNIGTITNINGIEPDETGTVTLHANDIQAITINLEETNEGEPALTNADMLGGIAADQYALKGTVVTSINGQTGDIVFEGAGTSLEFMGATAEANGAKGAVPAPVAGDQNKYLRADGTWSDIILPGDDTISEIIESMDIHVDTADTAYDAEKLGGVLAEEYALKSDLENIDITSMVVLKRLNVTVPANGWVQQNTGRYTQTIQVSDLTSHSVCHHADVNMSEVTEETAADIKQAWSMIDNIETTDAGVVFTSFTEAPQVDLNVYIDIEEFIETVPNANGVIF